MGAQLALAAFGFANLADLKPVARALLVFMALRALDDGTGKGKPERRSFMKRSQLAVGIGRMMPDREPGPDASAEAHQAWDADDQAVSRALRSLKTTGAIREVAPAHAGRTSEYEICLDLASRKNSRTGSQTVPLIPTKNEPVGVRFVTELGDGERTPKKQVRNNQKQMREIHHFPGPPHVATILVTEDRADAIELESPLNSRGETAGILKQNAPNVPQTVPSATTWDGMCALHREYPGGPCDRCARDAAETQTAARRQVA